MSSFATWSTDPMSILSEPYAATTSKTVLPPP